MLANEDEIILEGLTLIVTEPQKLVLSIGELKLAISLQQSKVDFLSAAKDKETVYELVILETLKFLLNGSILELKIENESSTQQQLSIQIHEIASQMYKAYLDNLPDSSYMLDIKTASDDDLTLLNDALNGDLDAMISLADRFEKMGNDSASAYWKSEHGSIASKSGGDVDQSEVEVSPVQSEDIKPAVAVQEKEKERPAAVKEKKKEQAASVQDKTKGKSASVQEKTTQKLTSAKENAKEQPADTDGPYKDAVEKYVPKWFQFLLQVEDGHMRVRLAVNAAKASALLLCLLLGLLFGQLSNPTFTTYIALHGTYGICWLIKSHLFADKQWDQKVPLSRVIETFIVLQSYFAPALLICFRGINLHPLFNALCIAIFTIGVLFHFGSDLQKSVALQYNPGFLITDRFHSIVRNPNYFGELMIYSSFALLSASLIGFIPLLSWVYLFWLPAMDRKERSLGRYKDWAAYSSKTKKLIPYCY